MLLHIILSFSCSTAEPDQTPRPQSPAETFCDNLGDAVARCGGSACDQAIAADCSSIAGLVNEPLLIDRATCLADGGGPADCLLGALESAVPSVAHRAFAESFCANCALGVPGCTAAFFDGSSGDTG